MTELKDILNIIPKQGIWCWCNHYQGDYLRILKIVEYRDKKAYPYRSESGSHWMYAYPIKLDEIKESLLEFQNEEF